MVWGGGRWCFVPVVQPRLGEDALGGPRAAAGHHARLVVATDERQVAAARRIVTLRGEVAENVFTP